MDFITRKKFSTFIALMLTAGLLLWGAAAKPVFAEAQNDTVYVPTLMYHHFAPSIDGRGGNGATVTTEKFKKDMEFLAENNYTALLPKDLEAITSGKADMPENPIIITFDDGYESTYTQAFSVLKDTGMKATVFVIAGTIENSFRSGISKLSWEQAREMYESGIVDIQSHSYDMHNSGLGGKYVRYELNGIKKGLLETKYGYGLRVGEDITKSVEIIEEKVGNNVTCYSYPYGVYEEWGRDLLEKNGVKFGFGTVYGSSNFSDNLYYLNRFSVGMSTDLKELLMPDKE